VSDGPVFLQRERPACAGQQLISGPLTNVMEEPAVELPLLDGPEIRKIMSRQLESYGINILKLHAEWLQANGYKQQASSCKRQIRMILINKKKKAASSKLDNGSRIL
jgi:hypothetical protein